MFIAIFVEFLLLPIPDSIPKNNDSHHSENNTDLLNTTNQLNIHFFFFLRIHANHGNKETIDQLI